MLPSGEESQEIRLANAEEYNLRTVALSNAMGSLKDREKDIIIQRRLVEPPATLEDLSQKYGISRERVRQIEGSAMKKLQNAMLTSPAAATADENA
jgi:RNA polymerase sigma-32 factor